MKVYCTSRHSLHVAFFYNWIGNRSSLDCVIGADNGRVYAEILSINERRLPLARLLSLFLFR